MFDSSIKKGKGRRENSCTESHVEDEVVGRHLAFARLGLFLILGIWGNAGYPPSPWPIGIFNLRGNCELNLGAQALRGKILSRKELRCDFSLKIATIWNHHSGLARGSRDSGGIFMLCSQNGNASLELNKCLVLEITRRWRITLSSQTSPHARSPVDNMPF